MKVLASQTAQFDIVVTDIMMPGRLQGPDLVPQIRGIWPTMPDILMSGCAYESEMHGPGLRDSDITLLKPVRRSLLLSAVRNALQDHTLPLAS